MGHICYYATAKGGNEKAVFTGDTLVRSTLRSTFFDKARPLS